MSADGPTRSEHDLSGSEPPRPCAEHHASALQGPPSPRRWREKFRDAFRGLRLGVWGQSSFAVHFGMALLALIAGAVLQVSRLEWAMLVLCIFMVLAAEMFNSSLEWLAKAFDRRPDERIGAALDIGSAAVLLAALGAAIVGVLILGFHLGLKLGWWAPR